MTHSHWFFFFVLAGVCGCQNFGGKPSHQVRTFLGEPAVAILSNPDRVQTFRVYGSRGAPAPATETREKLDGYPLMAKGADRDAAFGNRLARVFFSDKSYQFNRGKGCIFDPGVVFRVWSGARYADIILCFHCSDFRIIVFGENGQKINDVGQQFDDSRPELVTLAKEAFPADAEIQALK